MQHDPSNEVNDTNPAPAPEVWMVIIDAYTRADAIADGSLIEVPRQAAYSAGFRAPVAITRAVYLALVADPDASTSRDGDTERAFTNHEWQHARRVCRAATFKLANASKAEKNSPELWFTVSDHRLILHVGPDDNGALVFTIMTEADR